MPYNHEYMSSYIAYTVVVEEFRRTGYPEATMTLYPRVVCNDPYGCSGMYAPAPSQLEVRYAYQDACYSGVYEAFDIRGYLDPVRSAVLNDNYGNTCGILDQLTAEITHSDGTRESLRGYRTY